VRLTRRIHLPLAVLHLLLFQIVSNLARENTMVNQLLNSAISIHVMNKNTSLGLPIFLEGKSIIDQNTEGIMVVVGGNKRGM
jgi:hypothetical protein